MVGEVEIDESYFGAPRVKGKRGLAERAAKPLYKRNGKIFTEIVPKVQKKTLQAIILERVKIETIIHSNNWRGCNGLVY